MNRDSDIVYDLVTSKYKIADRNRMAKMRFLNEMKNGKSDQIKRRDSEPSMAQTEKAEGQKFDLSVPGTPVSSRYIQGLRFNAKNIDSDSENEDNDEHDGTIQKQSLKYQSVLAEGLKQFTADMEKLQSDTDTESCDPLQKYFEESDKKKTYRRDFAEVVSEFHPKKKEPAVKARVDRYFQESARRNSFRRDFSEVIESFDPRNPNKRDIFVDLNVPGTPISSRLIAAERKVDIDVEKTNGTVANELIAKTETPTANINESQTSIIAGTPPLVDNSVENNIQLLGKLIETENPLIEHETIELKIIGEEDNDIKDEPLIIVRSDTSAVGAVEPPVENVPTDVKEELISVTDHGVKETNASVPGTPVSSRNIPSMRNNQNYIETDDSDSEDGDETHESKQIKTLAQEVVHEIENLVQKSFDDDDRQEIVLEELKKLTLENNSNTVEQQKGEKLTTTDDVKANNSMLIKNEDREPVGIKIKAENSSLINLGVSELLTDTESDGIVLEELKKVKVNIVTDEMNQQNNDVKLLSSDDAEVGNNELISLVDPNLSAIELNRQAIDTNPVETSADTVNDYLQTSTKERYFHRTFTEVEDFNEKVLLETREKINKYFEESKEKKSLTRSFTEAVNYIEPKIDIEQLLKPGTPVSSEAVMSIKKKEELKANVVEIKIDPEVARANEIFRKAQEALHQEHEPKDFKVENYFKESEERKTLKRNFSEVVEEINKPKLEQQKKNPEIEKYFEQSAAEGTFRRQFSQVAQTIPPQVKDILTDEKHVKEAMTEAPFHFQRSQSRNNSVSSNCSDDDDALPRKPRKHGKKFGIDKYFAASLYRTAYQKSNSRRQSKDDNDDTNDVNELKIVESDVVFGEALPLRAASETFERKDHNDVNENQTAEFWREFLKPYTLNLQTDIVTRDDLINNRTLE